MTKQKKIDKIDKMDFEKSMSEISTIVTDMERGQLSLEASLKLFEQGVHLIRDCQIALDAAEQRVQLLTQTPAGEILQDLDHNLDRNNA